MKFNKIAIIGMMGCGKSTISKLLAEKIGFKYIDTDEIFEKENNIKIKDFFQKFSEELFRKKETEILKNLLSKENIIISTGGGIILKEENRELLFNKNIYTIYLKTSAQCIFERIKNDTSRPLLLVDNPKSEIEKILKSREDFYNMANIKISTDGKSKEDITEEIWKKLI